MDQKIRRFHPPAFKEQKRPDGTFITIWEPCNGDFEMKGQAEKILAGGSSDKRQQKEKDEHGLVQELYRQTGRPKWAN